MHGGKAPQVKQAAKHRAATMEAHAEAARMVASAGVDADPIEHLVDSLLRIAALAQVYGSMVAELDAAAARDHAANEYIDTRGELTYVEDDDEDSRDVLRVTAADRLLGLNKHGEAQLHPYVVEYHRLLEQRAKLAKMAIDAGVEERRVRMVEAQVEMTQRALDAALDEAGLDDRQREEARRGFARHLRAVG